MISQVQSQGIDGWIRGQMSLQLGTTHEAYIDSVITADGFADAEDFYETWWRQAISNQDQLRQRVAFAYSQIFVISLNDPTIDAARRGVLLRHAYAQRLRQLPHAAQ